MKRGSALIMALLIIAVLSVIVFSFSFEANLQTGINVYMRERARVNRLTESGRVIAEMLLENFASVEDATEDEDLLKILREEDRWIREKRQIKLGRETTVGPILLDAKKQDSGTLIDAEKSDPGTVTIKIRMSNCSVSGLNVNELVDGSDSSYQLRWELIFQSHGLPLDFEVEVEDVGRVPLASHLIACWCDWVDSDDVVKSIDNMTCGAEADWYEKYYEDNKEIDDEDRKFPRNGPINEVNELSFIRGFRDYPAILTGGPILGKDEKEDPTSNPTVRGIMSLFSTKGTAKVNVNDCTVDQLLTVPGVFCDDDDDDLTDARHCAEAIVDGLYIKPERREVLNEESGPWEYLDFNDLRQRLSDQEVDIGSEAEQYFVYKPSDTSLFDIEIIGESLGMSHTVKATGYLKDGKVRYVEWRED